MKKQICAKYDTSHIKIESELLHGIAYILEKQKKFSKKWVDYDKLNLKEKEKWTWEFLTCLTNEIEEIRDWTRWKHWKDYKDFKVNEHEIKYEIIDLIHFVFDLCLVWGMDAKEILTIYTSKNEQNHNRQNNPKFGYVKKGEKNG